MVQARPSAVTSSTLGRKSPDTTAGCSDRAALGEPGRAPNIHRLPHETQGTVFAYRSEIDRWWNSRQKGHAQIANSERPLFHRRWFLIAATVAAIFVLAFAGQTLRRRSNFPSVTIPRLLTANSIENRVLSVAISPDGKYLAYSDDSGILVKHIDTGEIQSLPSTKGLYVQNWFPDGSRVLASRYADPSLWIVSVLNGAAQKIQEDAAAGAVSPDGLHIIFWRNYASELWLIGAGGENPKKLVTAQPSEIFTDFCWSFNGQRFAYLKARQGREADNVTIETRDLNGEDSTIILSDPRLITGGATGLAWLPDGRLIFSLQNSASNQLENNIWVVRTDTRTGRPIGEPRQLTGLSGFLLLYFSLSADGKRLAFLQVREQFGIHVAKIDRNTQRLVEARPLTLDKWNNIPSAWTSDSQAILFESNRNGHAQIFKQRLDKPSPEAMLVGEDNHHRPGVSPDHAWLLFWIGPQRLENGLSYSTSPAKDVRSTRLMRSNIWGGPVVEVLTVSGFASHSCSILPPNRCVLGEQINNQLVFSVFDPVQGRGDELTRISINRPGITWSRSPDGTRIAIGDARRIRIVDLKTGLAKDFVPTIRLVDLQSVAWSPDGKGLFVSVSPEIRTVLFYADLAGNARQLIQYDGWIGNLVPSPDGRYLAFSKTTQEINAAMIENF
jgi:Tol biopolymer transport system component